MRVTEIIPCTIQGEGIRCGEISSLIRLSGCNLNCSWCDTKYSWKDGKEMSIDKIVSKCVCRSVIITGGEPLLWMGRGLEELVLRLREFGSLITIETNGTIIPTNGLKRHLSGFSGLWSVSPKIDIAPNETYDKTIPAFIRMANSCNLQFKFVVGCKRDLQSVKSFIKRYGIQESSIPIVLQPNFEGKKYEDGRLYANLISSVLQDVELREWGVRILPQLHKFGCVD